MKTEEWIERNRVPVEQKSRSIGQNKLAIEHNNCRYQQKGQHFNGLTCIINRKWPIINGWTHTINSSAYSINRTRLIINGTAHDISGSAPFVQV